MAVFPADLAAAAQAAGLRLSPFDWTAHRWCGQEAVAGTAVIGDPERLEAFRRRFIAQCVGEGVRIFTPEPESQTTESVIYFPNYYLEDE